METATLSSHLEKFFQFEIISYCHIHTIGSQRYNHIVWVVHITILFIKYVNIHQNV